MNQTPQEIIPRAVELHDRGLIGPSEMWNIISDSVNRCDVGEALSQLPPSLLARLYDIHLEWAAAPSAFLEPSAPGASVINWLIANRSK